MDAKSQPDDVCVVCCRKIILFAIGVCDHPVCYECSTRMRVLCRQNECPICRRDMPKVIFTYGLQPFSSISEYTYPMDKKYNIWFEDEAVHQMFEKLLEHNCQICSNKPNFSSFSSLKEHVRREHERHYCDLCVENLRIFTFERKSYSRKELALHRRIGDSDDTSHRGHPLCSYCDERYVDNDELFRHLRREHYFCHFCDIDVDKRHQFYSDYEFLRSHFREEHYLCEEGACREEKFTAAFRSEIDLKAHRAMHHSKNLSKAEAKQARTLELEFTIAPRKQQNGNAVRPFCPEDSSYRRGRRDYRRGRGNQSNKDREYHSAVGGVPQQTTDTVQQPKWDSADINMQSEKDFPHLISTKTPNSTHSTPVNVDGNTLANRIARSNHFTIRASERSPRNNVSRITEEEFPSLGSTVIKIPPSRFSNLSSQSSQVTVTSCPHSPNSSGARNTLMFHFNSKESGNSTSRHPPNVSIQVSTSPNTAAHSNVEKNDSSKKTSNCQNISIFPSNLGFSSVNSCVKLNGKENSIESGKSVLGKTLKSRNFDEEFPELEVQKELINNRTSVVIPVSQTNIDDSETKNCQPYITVKCKSKKKKQKTPAIEPETKEISVINEPNKKKKKEPILTQQKVELHNCSKIKESVENRENEDPLKEMPLFDSSSSKKEQEAHADDYDVTEDLSKQTMNLVMEDFPPLPMTRNSSKIPPGFVCAKPQNSVSLKQEFTSDVRNSPLQPASPSVNISLSSVARQLTSAHNSSINNDSLNIHNRNHDDVVHILSQQVPKYTYIQPVNFKERNRELIQQILNLVDRDNDRFNNFKTLSGHFRQNSIAANNYYEKCLGILGRDKLFQVLPELLVLLPDISKQQELLAVHNNFYQREAESGGAVPKNRSWNSSDQSTQFLVCATCQQVLINKDFRNHMLQHKDNGFCLFEDDTSNATHTTWVKK